MLTTTRRTSLLVFSLILCAATPAAAQDPNDWAKKMFDSLSHDFGTVAKGAEVVHRFRVKNLYKEDMQIASVTTSCGCTAPKFDQTPVKSLDSTYIEISMDTNRFQREKTSNVTVTFNQPIFATVVIPVKVYIRTDVVVTPTSINFGAVEKGTRAERKMTIAYAGRPDWKILKVVPNNKYLQAQLSETARGADGQINYDLVVNLLPNAPVGALRQEISLMTDDANSPEIPILVQARVEADVTVTPSVIQLGSVGTDTVTTKTVMLRGHKPFVVEKVECDSNRQAFKMPLLTKDAKPFHVLSLEFTAPKEAGPFSEKFTVTIAGRPEPLVFTARGVIETAQRTSLPR